MFVFVYSKDFKIKVLSLENSQKEHDSLIEEGWVHTSTLVPCVFLEFIGNNCDGDDFINEMYSLTKISK